MDRDSLEARVLEFWSLMGPSFIRTAVEIIGPALELLGPSGPEKMLFDSYPFCGKRVLVCPGRRNIWHDFGGKG